MNQEKIGEFIQKLRKDKNLTQEELARKLNITKNAISKWERGISLMDISLLKPLSEILGVSITELLNGERIEEDNIKSKSDEVVNNTIILSNNKIKKSKFKSILLTTICIIILFVVVFFGYKGYLLNKYTFKKPDNVDEIVRGLKNQKEINVNKRTLTKEEYLTIENFKIRNDFKDYELTNKVNENMAIRSYTYKNEQNDGITISVGNDLLTLDNAFESSDIILFGSSDSNLDAESFKFADRKFFLLKNDINNEIDFYKYVANNYYKENNIFMDKRTMMENYAFNMFTSIVVPKVDEFIIIKGDYQGYIFKIIKDNRRVTQVTILRDGKVYGFLTNDSRFEDESYMIDLIGTIEIEF